MHCATILQQQKESHFFTFEMFSHLDSKWKFDTKMMVLVMIQMSRHSPSPRAGVGCRRQKARHPPGEDLVTLEEKNNLLLMIENMNPTSPIFNEWKTWKNIMKWLLQKIAQNDKTQEKLCKSW